jgi:hypothetical protein
MTLQITMNSHEAEQVVAEEKAQREAQAQPTAGVRINTGGVNSISISNGQATTSSSTVQRITTEDFTDGGIVGSLGFSRVHDKAVVQTPHGTMELRMAHQLGLVGKTSEGHYYDLGNEPSKKSSEVNKVIEKVQSNDQAQDQPQELPTEAAKLGLNVINSALPENSVDSMLTQVMEHQLNAAFNEDATTTPLSLEHFANEAGLPKEVLETSVSSVIDGFQRQADGLLKKEGINPDEFYGYLLEKHPEKVREAIKTHYQTKNPTVWKSLVHTYRTGVLPSDDTLARAGYLVEYHGKTRYINFKGVQMTVQAAANAGLI